MLPLLLALMVGGPIATLENREVNESSGVAASWRNPGLLWTHNDSGDGPYVYAFDKAGRNRGTFRLNGAKAVDWEDMAVGPCPRATASSCLYMGDIGDNDSVRKGIEIYIVPEPKVEKSAWGTTRRNAIGLGGVETWRLRYPDHAHDAETLLVHPRTGEVWLITKERRGTSRIFRVPEKGGRLRQVGEVATVGSSIPILGTAFLLTGGDISHDGQHVVLRDYIQAYEFTLPKGARDFDQIWKTRPRVLDVGSVRQGEGVAYDLDDRRLYLTSEGLPTPLMEVELKR